MLTMKFSEWLNKEMISRGYSQASLSKAVNVSDAHINHIVHGRRNPGPELCEGIAHAFKMPPEDVFRIAGLLPQKTLVTPTLNEVNYKMSLLNESAQKLVLDFVDMLLKRGTENEGDTKG